MGCDDLPFWMEIWFKYSKQKVFAPREKMNTNTLYLASFLPLHLPPLSLLYVNDSFSEL